MLARQGGSLRASQCNAGLARRVEVGALVVPRPISVNDVVPHVYSAPLSVARRSCSKSSIRSTRRLQTTVCSATLAAHSGEIGPNFAR
eukprot:1144916-Pelagomonas_calceolata.AAC.19